MLSKSEGGIALSSFGLFGHLIGGRPMRLALVFLF
mgnify:CR=1 FL=1|jgi:hypothetical protein